MGIFPLCATVTIPIRITAIACCAAAAGNRRSGSGAAMRATLENAAKNVPAPRRGDVFCPAFTLHPFLRRNGCRVNAGQKTSPRLGAGTFFAAFSKVARIAAPLPDRRLPAAAAQQAIAVMRIGIVTVAQSGKIPIPTAKTAQPRMLYHI